MRYFFHIREFGRLTPDEEGMELHGMTEARIEARLSAGDLAKAAMRGGEGFGASTIEIADGEGNVLCAIAIRSDLN